MTDYSKVRAIVAEADPEIRQSARGDLDALGFGDVTDTASLAKAHFAIRRTAVDLIVLSAKVEGEDTAFITKEIRSGRIGNDPFPIVIVLIPAANEALVRSIIDSGADDALLAPFPPDALAKKVVALSGPRKPFVVTSSYMGPERRAGPRSGEQQARQFEVPNPLAFKTIGADDAYGEMRAAVCAKIFEERAVRLASQIEWLAKAVRDAAPEESEVFRHLRGIEEVGRELQTRVNDPGQAEEINSVVHHAKTLRTAVDPVSPDEFERLYSVAKDIVGKVVPSA